jgi:hypothetical protein
MPTMPRSHIRPLLIALLLIPLLACKRQAPLPLQPDTPSPPTSVAGASTASSATAIATPSLGDFKVLSIALGRALDISNNLAEERSVFSPKDPIYAAVVTTGTHQGLMLSARWFDGDGKLLAQNDQRLVPDGPMLATFHLNPPHGWPKGHYKLDIALDGQLQQSKEFDVR